MDIISGSSHIGNLDAPLALLLPRQGVLDAALQDAGHLKVSGDKGWQIIIILWDEKRPQNWPKKWPKVTFEKDALINFQF